MKKIRKVIDEICELIYPSKLYCIICENLIDETSYYSLCSHCMSHIRWQNEIKSDSTYVATEEKSEHISNLYSCTRYGLYERNIIFPLKYEGKTYISRCLGKIFADKIRYESLAYDIIIDVPMNKGKEKKRGFNHSHLIAKYTVECLNDSNVKLLHKGLVRKKNTVPMRGLSKEERQGNVKDAFDCNKDAIGKLKGKKVLIIDDIYTTGSTVNECAKVLKGYGAASVDVMVFASGNKSVVTT